MDEGKESGLRGNVMVLKKMKKVGDAVGGNESGGLEVEEEVKKEKLRGKWRGEDEQRLQMEADR